jgi:ribosomal protein S6--L-glutamate ligase
VLEAGRSAAIAARGGSHELLLSISGRELQVLRERRAAERLRTWWCPRIGWTVADLGVAVVEQFERIGAIAINGAQAIARAATSCAVRAVALAARHPRSEDHPDAPPADVAWAIEQVGGPPVVLKLLQGAQGVGSCSPTRGGRGVDPGRAVGAQPQTSSSRSTSSESSGSDVRVFVIGGRAVAAMRRRARGSEFRSNSAPRRVGRGRCRRLGVRRAGADRRRTLDLDVAGVDLLEAKRGPLVVEVERLARGLEGSRRSRECDVAERFIAHIEERCATEPAPADVRVRGQALFRSTMISCRPMLRKTPQAFRNRGWAFSIPSDKSLNLKVVYYGPSFGGKTTSLQRVHEVLNRKSGPALISLDTEEIATLFFDYLPIHLMIADRYSVRIQGYTVPGQSKYATTRKLVLKGTDGIVFVADSQRDRLRDNLVLRRAARNLKELGCRSSRCRS